MSDRFIRSMLPSLRLRLVAALCTDTCRTAGQRHKAGPAATCALSRGLVAGILLSTLSKNEERVTIQVVSNGPLRGLTVDAYSDGLVRGYPLEPQACPGVDMSRRQRLAPLLGRDGVINVVRDIGVRDRYKGQVALVTSEIDEDAEAYLRDSEQIPSALGCEVVMDAAGNVLAAGGVLVQLMPDSPPEAKKHLRELQHSLRTGALYDALKLPGTSVKTLAELCGGDGALRVELLDEAPVRFQCRCDMQRIEVMLLGMDTVAFDEMIAEGRAEITCNYCGEVYLLSKDQLLRLRAQKPPREKQ